MRPEGCLASISLWCFDVFGLALEGINSKGLAVVHLADHDTSIDHEDLATHQTKKGFNEFLPIQYLLDNCSTVSEAATALNRMEHYHMAIPVHLLIADNQGTAFVFEYSHDGTRKVFVQGNATAPLKITNFQLNRLSDAAMTKEMESRSNENGLDRYRELEKRMRRTQFPITEKSIQEVNSEVYVYEDNSDALERTLYHCIYDTTTASVKICLLPGIKRSGCRFNHYSLQ
jgi:penicillin V acylase-like amidase (Ntn superfamily)